VINELFNQNYGLFVSSSNRQTYQPNPLSYLNRSHLEYFDFAGRMLGRAIVENVAVEPHLSSAVLKELLGLRPTLRDLEQVDPQIHSSLRWMLDHRLEEVGLTDLTFSIEFDDVGVLTTIDLMDNGSQVAVTDDNKAKYVALRVEHHLRKQIAEQLKAFREGFAAMVSKDEIRFFSPSELDLIICGVPEIDVRDFEANCAFVFPYDANHPVIAKFFKVIAEWDKLKLANLLIFITGSSRVPLGGFAAFAETSTQISIAPGGTGDHLPQAHTCINRLDLPEYSSEREMAEKLEYAIFECADFGIF
jgi:E3 ubiquitin-protein ligase HUWE1